MFDPTTWLWIAAVAIGLIVFVFITEFLRSDRDD